MTDSQAQHEVPGERLGSGAVADVFAYGADALKLYHEGRGKAEAFVESANLSIVEQLGVPAPRVHATGLYFGRWGLVMDRIGGEPLAGLVQADPAAAPLVLEEMVRLQLALHALADTRLRPLKARLAANIARTPLLPGEQKAALAERLNRLPAGDRLCHGDLHPLNIVGTPGAALIIDWLDLTSGPPAADACRSYLLLLLAAPDLAEAYLDLYAARSGVARPAILDWLPVVAAARLAENAGDEDVLLTLAG